MTAITQHIRRRETLSEAHSAARRRTSLTRGSAFTHLGGDRSGLFREAERAALRTPVSGELRRVDLVQDEMCGLTPVKDRLDDVRREVSEANDLPGVAVRKALCIGKSSDRRIDSAFHFSPPVMPERDGADERFIALARAVVVGTLDRSSQHNDLF